MPGDIYLSDAMATSAAAIDHHMGALEGEELFKDLKVTLGIAMGTSIVSDPRQEKRLNTCLQVGEPIFRYANESNLFRYFNVPAKAVHESNYRGPLGFFSKETPFRRLVYRN